MNDSALRVWRRLASILTFRVAVIPVLVLAWGPVQLAATTRVATSCETGRFGCVWEKPASGSDVSSAVKGLLERSGVKGLESVGVSIDGPRLIVDAKLGDVRRKAQLLLDGPCEKPPTVESSDLPLHAAAMDAFVAALPMQRVPVCDISTADFDAMGGLPSARGTVIGTLWRKTLHLIGGSEGLPIGWPDRDRIVFLVIAIIGLMLFAVLPRSRRGKRARWLLAHLLLLVTAAIALVPMLFGPLDIGSEVERIILAQLNPLGDWNHPSLIYLLNHIPTRLSLAPWFVRLVPVAAVVGLGYLVFLAGRRFAGDIPGILAALWYLGGTRARMGLADMGDWDLAGCFLMGLILLLDRIAIRENARPSRGETAGFLAMMLLGSMSSWLALVPLGILVGATTVAYRSVREWRPLLLGAWSILLVRGIQVLKVVGDSGSISIPETLHALLRQVVEQLQAGTNWLGLLLVAVGALAILAQRRRVAPLVMLGSVLAVPPAVVAIWWIAAVNGGYYVNIISSFVAVLGAVGLGSLVREGEPGPAEVSGWWPSIVPSRRMFAIVVGATAFTTVNLPPMNTPVGIGNVPAFVREIADDALPVVTDVAGLGPLVAYQIAADTSGDLGHAREVHALAESDGYFDGRRKWVHVPEGIRQGIQDLFPEGTAFYLVLRDAARLGGVDFASFPEGALSRCVPLYPPKPDATFLRCGGP